MIEQPVFRHFFVFRPRAPPVAVRIDGNAAARGEFAPHFDIARFHDFNQIVHNDVDAIFVKVAMIAEAEQIQLQ